MTKRIALLFWFLLLLSFRAGAAELNSAARDQTFREASAAYSRGEFAEAARGYHRIASSGWRAAALFYNLGNAWFKQGDLARAIRNYRRAEELSPRDPEIAKNLEYARGAIEDDTSPPSPAAWSKIENALVRLLPLSGWAALALIVFWLAVLWILAAILFPALRPANRPVLRILILVFLVLALGTWRARVRASRAQGIILPAEVVARYSPGPEETEAFLLHTGTEVRLLRRDGSGRWAQIALPDGKSGWIPVSALARI